MAESIETKKEPAQRSHAGANAESNAAVPTPKGTATTMARTEVTTVPYTKARAPKCRCVGSGSHVLVIKKVSPVVSIASQAFQTRTATRRRAMAMTRMDAAWHR